MNNNTPRAPYLWAFVLFSLLAAFTLWLGTIPYDWSNWSPATCMPKHCFCEGLRQGTLRQPANTYSNLGFVLVGFFVIASLFDTRLRRRDTKALIQQLSFTIIYGLAMILIGLGSMLYHASLTFVGQWFDVMAMYLLASFMLLYGLVRMRKLGPTGFVLTYLGTNAVLGYVLVAYPVLRRYLFSALMLGTLFVEIKLYRDRQSNAHRPYLLAAIASFLAAFGIWILDLTHLLCWPSSLWQGHSLWHLLCALAGSYIFRYYLSGTTNAYRPS